MSNATIRTASDKCNQCAEYGEFRFDGNTITTPGKFEAEQDYAIHFYHLMTEGFLDLCDCGADYCEIEQAEIDLFPELADSLGGFVHVHESEVGFFNVEIVSKGEYSDHVDGLEIEVES